MSVSVSSLMRKKEQGYIGDKILAAYQFLNSCLCLGAGSVLAAISFGLASEPQVLKDWQRSNPGTVVEKFAKPQYAVALGVILALSTLCGLIWIVCTWKGRRWALWLHLFLAVPSLIGSGYAGTPLGALLPLAVMIYCGLRLSGSLGWARAPARSAPKKRMGAAKKKARPKTAAR